MSWSMTIVVNKRVLDRVTPLGVNFLVRGVAAAAELVLILVLIVAGVWRYGFGLNWAAAGWIAANAFVAWVVAFNAYYYALRDGSVGVVAPIVSTDPLWTALFAAAALGSVLGVWTLVGLVTAMAGVALISRWSGGELPEGDPEVLPGAPSAAGRRRTSALVILLAVLTAAGWGLNPVLIELAENAYGSPSAGMILESQLLGMLFIGVLIKVRRSPLTARRLEPGERLPVAALLIAAGLLEGVFAIGFYVVIDQIGSVLTTLIIASSPVFSLLGGAVFLRERVGLKLALGAAVTMGGVLLATAARLL